MYVKITVQDGDTEVNEISDDHFSAYGGSSPAEIRARILMVAERATKRFPDETD